MTEADIEGSVFELVDAIKNKEEEVLVNAGLRLLTVVLVDLHRVAEALELLATTEAHRVRT
jgi:hypothetical protein